MKTLDELIAEAKLRQKLDKRSSNRGRPRIGLPKNQGVIVSSMRKKGVHSIKLIHSLMLENGMTQYSKYGTFLAAYKDYKLNG